jgi:signal transduction histidine kinase
MLSGHKLRLSNISLESHLPPGLPPIRGDYNQVQQCVINLILNSIDALPEGGKLIVTTSHSPGDRTVTIQVKDTGCGIKTCPTSLSLFLLPKAQAKVWV